MPIWISSTANTEIITSLIVRFGGEFEACMSIWSRTATVRSTRGVVKLWCDLRLSKTWTSQIEYENTSHKLPNFHFIWYQHKQFHTPQKAVIHTGSWRSGRRRMLSLPITGRTDVLSNISPEKLPQSDWLWAENCYCDI